MRTGHGEPRRVGRSRAAAVWLPIMAVLAAGLAQSQALADTSESASVAARSTVGEQRWVVVLRPTSTTAQIDAEAGVASSTGARVERRFSHALRGYSVRASAAQAAALAARADVVAVAPDAVVHAADTQSPVTWGLDRIDQAAPPLSTSFSTNGTGAGVRVYVVDSGLRSTHTEFTGRVGAGFTAISDGLGTGDCNGHGTHVAGTAVGTTYGVAKSATVVPVRVLDCTGSGFVSDIISGLDWVVAQHGAGTPAVVNMSLEAAANPALDAAVRSVVSDGVTVVVAAGNSSIDACTNSPARVSTAITVGAMSQADAQSAYSNFGTCLDVYAPGDAIVSAYFGNDTQAAVASGTSQASPHVAGVAALLLGRTPNATPATIASTITSTATVNALSGTGAGSPNRLLFADPTVALTGNVRDLLGAAAPGVAVEVRRPDGTPVASATTGAAGQYSVRVTTGSLLLTVSSTARPVALMPSTWAFAAIPLTVNSDRSLDLALPAGASMAVTVYDPSGSALSGVPVRGISSYSSTSMYSLGAGLAPVAPTTTLGQVSTDAQGIARLVGFPGTAGTIYADDTSTGTLRRGIGTGLVVRDGGSVGVQAGATGLHTPLFLAVDPGARGLMTSLLASQADVVTVPIGAAAASAPTRFGCTITPPADSTQAQLALLGSTYLDASSAAHDAPAGLCALTAVTTP